MIETHNQSAKRVRSGWPYPAFVFSSRVRLARNLHGMSFPGWAGSHARAAVWERVVQALRRGAYLDDPRIRAMGELTPLERTMLQERRLISAELAAGDATSGVIYEAGGRLSIMVNEEDHMRLQSVAAGFALEQAWSAVDALHAALAEALPLAFSQRYGYLTACPSNVGTGMRASVMVHLAGLRLTGELDAVVRGLERTGFAVRGTSGEGSQAHGSLYQISNQQTLGLDASDTLAEVRAMVAAVLQAEYAARQRLVTGRPFVLADCLGRAYGLLRHAVLLTTGEAFDSLSSVMLGLERGRIRGVDMDTCRRLLQDVQPGHLQFRYSRTLSAVERDQFRATVLREALASMELI